MDGFRILLLTALAVVAPLNWWSRAVGSDRAETVTKPVASVLLLTIAATAPVGGGLRAWVVAAMALSLAGDVALMLPGAFLAGLGLFLSAHLAYLAALLTDPDPRPAGAALAALAGTAMAATVGRRIVTATGGQAGAVRVGVVAYVAVILTMAAVALTAGPWLAAVGAVVFVASDSCLGWNRFVQPARWLETATMVTYHLGQLALIAGLVLR